MLSVCLGGRGEGFPSSSGSVVESDEESRERESEGCIGSSGLTREWMDVLGRGESEDEEVKAE